MKISNSLWPVFPFGSVSFTALILRGVTALHKVFAALLRNTTLTQHTTIILFLQAYTMCVMNYDFVVLDNAFLIHKPGVKKAKVQMQKFNNVVQKSSKLLKRIALELQDMYGYNTNCSTSYNPAVVRRLSQIKSKPAQT